MQLCPFVEKGHDIYITWTFTEDEAKKLKTLYDKYAALPRLTPSTLGISFTKEYRMRTNQLKSW